MKCDKCGHNNDEQSIFCKKCGARIVAAPEEVTVQSEEQTDKSASGSKNTDKNSSKKYDSKTASPLSKAWNDIKGTKSWFGKIVVLGLIECVPILDFASTGFAQQWGVSAAKKDNKPMTSDYISNVTFLSGFFELLTWIVYGIVWAIASWVATSILGMIPIVGAIIGLAIFIAGIFWNSIVSLASLRCAFNNQLEQSFKVKEIFSSWKKGWSTLFVSYFVPSLICKLITLAAGVVMFVICAGAFLPTIVSIAEGGVSTYLSQGLITTLYNYIPYILQFAGSIVLVLVLVYIVGSIISAFEKMLRYRAVGYWYSEYGTSIK